MTPRLQFQVRLTHGCEKSLFFWQARREDRGSGGPNECLVDWLACDVLRVERSRYTEADLALADAQIADAQVDLFRALGGGRQA